MKFPWPIVLGSGSPRRKELLESITSDFTVTVPQTDESLIPGERMVIAVERLAIAKALEASRFTPGSLIIAADTLVGISLDQGDTIFGKPGSAQEAEAMLGELSGRRHYVATGVCLRLERTQISFAEVTEVEFRPISPDEIKAYVETEEPLDKAGSYAIQGGAKPFVESVEGSLSNVIGLPLERLEMELKKLASGAVEKTAPENELSAFSS